MLAISIVPLPVPPPFAQPLLGLTDFVPLGINAADAIVGTTYDYISGGPTPSIQGSFAWRAGQGYTQVGPVETPYIQYWDHAQAINAAGDAGGYFQFALTQGSDEFGQDVPFRTVSGDVQRLDTGNGDENNGAVMGLDAADDAVGTDNFHATYWAAGAAAERELGLPGDSYSSANAINDKGQIVGYSGDRPFLLSGVGGTATYLPTNGGEAANATAINDEGWIIGVGAKGEGLLWAPDPSTGRYGVATLDFTPLAINNHDIIVGGADATAIIWTAATGDVTLQSLLPSSLQYNPITHQGWTMDGVTAINDQDDLTGSSNLNAGGDEPYLLTGLQLERVTPTSLRWGGTPQGGADFRYSVSGSIQAATTIGLYWATGPDASDVIGSPVFSRAVAPGSPGTYGPIHVPQSAMASPPITAKDLLVVADPDDLLGDAGDPSEVMALARGPEVVNVVTHGFNPYQPLSTFMAPWQTLANELDTYPAAGSPLSGNVATYVPQWDSTTGWAGDFLSTIASYLLPGSLGPLAGVAQQLFAYQAAALAEQAAESTDQAITNPANGYLTAPGAAQVIDLIGHSRGAAVNARVSQLLEAQGYTVAQYISLDGYSTDWPFPSNHFGDISIVGNATATNMVNDEVQEGIASVLVTLLEDLTGKSLASDETKALIDVATNWKAPDRAGFQNTVIPGPAPNGDPLSNHLNIVSIYSDEANPYIKQLFDWIMSNAPGSSGGNVVPAAAPAVATATSFGNFRDGSFATLGSFWSQIQAAHINPGDSTVLAAWLGMVDNPAQLLASTWDVAGDATLVQPGGVTGAQLALDQGTASIGQYIELGSSPSAVSFDASVQSAKPGDQLQVLFGGNVVASWSLSSLPASGQLTVSLAKYASQDGDVTVQLVGPSTDAAEVVLDNLAIQAATATASGSVFVDLNGDGKAEGGEPGVAGRTVFADLNGDGTLDPGDPSAVTGANGQFTLAGIPILGAAGTSSITLRLVPLPGDNPTGSAASGLTLNLSVGQTATGANIGVRPTGVIAPLHPINTPFASGADLDTSLVAGLYKTILGRAPDAPGLSAGVKFLQSGGSVSGLAAIFLDSTERETDLVESYYRAFLGRTADPGGLSAAVKALQAGISERALASSLLGSAEFSKDHADNGSFVQALYADTLGRVGTSAEVAAWVALLAAGKLARAQATADFVNSTEATDHIIAGAYVAVLGREAAPAELAAWQPYLTSGQLTVDGFEELTLASAEFAARARAGH